MTQSIKDQAWAIWIEAARYDRKIVDKAVSHCKNKHGKVTTWLVTEIIDDNVLSGIAIPE